MKRLGVRAAFLTIASALFILTCAAPLISHAQAGLLGIEHALSIAPSPAHPSPGEAVHLSLTSAILDLAGSSIVWREREKTIAEGTGVTSADVAAGALRTENDIDVTVTTPDGIVASANIAIIPTELDLLVDSDSYVPPFYRGRALPTAGTNLILQVIPYFSATGGPLSATDLIYTWRRNNEVIGAVSGKGHSSVVISAPHLFGTDTISVEARSGDGLFSDVTSISIPSVEPALVLYQDHPLYGIEYGRGLSSTTFIPESEMTFAAIPYFAQARRANDPLLAYAWRVNDAAIPSSPAAENELTINAANSTGRALIGLELTHRTNYYLEAKGAWNVTFSAAPSARNPFGTF